MKRMKEFRRMNLWQIEKSPLQEFLKQKLPQYASSSPISLCPLFPLYVYVKEQKVRPIKCALLSVHFLLKEKLSFQYSFTAALSQTFSWGNVLP